MTDWPTWEQLKQEGSEHYKTGGVEPIDLYRSLSPIAFHHWVIQEISQHALRNLEPSDRIESDMEKVIHYARLVIANHKEQGGA